MDWELRNAASKLKASQSGLDAAAKKRLAIDAKKLQLAAERAAREEKQRLRRVAENEAAAEVSIAQEASLSLNAGVAHKARLAPLRSQAAVDRGIKRHADKITLPPSVGRSLESQRVGGHATAWEIRCTRSNRRAHATALDFSAPEGRVGCPPHVLEQLGYAGASVTDSDRATDDDSDVDLEGDGVAPMDIASTSQPSPPEASPLTAALPAHFEVTYRRLPKGTYAKLRPRLAAFARDVLNVRTELESALAKHSTLTVGEVVVVVAASTGLAYEIECLEVQPEDQGAVSVVETDMEVDIAPSVEYEEAIVAKERAAHETRQRALTLEAEQREARERAEATDKERAEERDRAVARAREALEGIATSSGSDEGGGDGSDGAVVCELIVEVVATGHRLRISVERTATVDALVRRVRAGAAKEALEALDAGTDTDAADSAIRAAAALAAPTLELVPALPGAKALPVGSTLAEAGVGRRERLIARVATVGA